MRRESRGPRYSLLPVALVVMLWGDGGYAQPATVPQAPPSPAHERTDRALLRAGEALAGAQRTAPQPKGRDPVLNGVLLGAGIGALLGLIPDYYDDCAECHDSLYASIAIGAGIGLLVDLLRSDRRPTSTSPTGDGFRVGIAGSGHAVGVGGVLRWR